MQSGRHNFHRSILITLILVFVVVGPRSLAADEKPAIHLKDPYILYGQVAVDFELAGFLDESAFELLESGLPSTLTISVDLWRDRSNWWDSHVQTVSFSFKIFYNVLDEKYEVFDEDEGYVSAHRSREDLFDLVARETGLEIYSVRRMNEKHRYFVEVGVRLEPLSVEELREFEKWVRGSFRREDERRGISGVSKYAVGLLKNAIGLGDRSAFQRSDPFRLNDLDRVEAEKR